MRSELRDGMLLITSTAISAVLSMLYSILVGRWLGPDDYADFTAAVSIVALLSMAFGPINGTMARFASQYAVHGDFGKICTLRRAIVRRLAMVSVLAALGGWFTVEPLTRVFNFSSTIPICFSYALTILYLLLSTSRGVLRGVQEFRAYSVNVVVEATVRLIIGGALIYMLSTVLSALLGQLLSVALVVLMGELQARRVWRGHPKQPVDRGAVRRYSLSMLALSLCVAGYQNIDLLMVKNQFSGENAGQYSAAFTLARSMTALVTPFSVMLVPLVSVLHEQGKRISGSILRASTYYLALATGPMLLFTLWPQGIITRLYGAEYAPAGSILAWLTLAQLVGNLGGLLALAHTARSDFRFLFLLAPALAAEAGALAVYNSSLAAVVWVVVFGQSLRLLSVLLMFLIPSRTPRPN